MRHLSVLAPGQLTTVQDGGRRGLQGLGVTPGGAADTLALRVGNWLVGNPAGAAALELTWTGPQLAFAAETLIALTGAAADAHCGGSPVPGWRPVWMAAGSRLSIGALSGGARAYLCVQGGIRVPPVLGGYGTDLRGRFGGLNGRALARGDRLDLAAQPPRYPRLRAGLAAGAGFSAPAWQVSMWRDNTSPDAAPIRLLPGADQPRLSVADRTTLFSSTFGVLPESDRQGLRLAGTALHLTVPRRRSAGVCPGVMQLTPDGRPILLLADCQTTGGYPVIGVAARIDQPRLAQLRPGDRVRFTDCHLAEAHRLLALRERRLALIQRELTARWQRY